MIPGHSSTDLEKASQPLKISPATSTEESGANSRPLKQLSKVERRALAAEQLSDKKRAAFKAFREKAAPLLQNWLPQTLSAVQAEQLLSKLERVCNSANETAKVPGEERHRVTTCGCGNSFGVELDRDSFKKCDRCSRICPEPRNQNNGFTYSCHKCNISTLCSFCLVESNKKRISSYLPAH